MAQKKKKSQKDGNGRADDEVPFISIAEAINSTQWRRATDPRDHFFGVLGLLPQAWRAYFQEVGYGCSAGSLFAQCTKLLYVNDSHLGQLGCAVGLRHAAPAPQDLPTWAIDLSRASGHDEDGADRWALYDAYPGPAYDDDVSGVRFMHDLQDPALKVQGTYVGRVAACASRTSNNHWPTSTRAESCDEQPKTQVPRDEAHLTLALVTEWKTLYEAHSRPARNPASSTSGGGDDDSFWRTAFMDRDIWRYWLHKCRPLPGPKLHDVKAWWQNFATATAGQDYRDLVPDQQPGPAGRGTYHYRALTLNMEQCRFFCTDGGEPGLGPHDVAPGDEVFILAGCRSPAVLRPIARASGSHQNGQETGESDGDEKGIKKKSIRRIVLLRRLDVLQSGNASITMAVAGAVLIDNNDKVHPRFLSLVLLEKRDAVTIDS